MTNGKSAGQDERQCVVCVRMRKRSEYQVSLSGYGTRCINSTDCFAEIERQKVVGLERYVYCYKCRKVLPLMAVRMVLPQGLLQCIDQQHCRHREREAAAAR